MLHTKSCMCNKRNKGQKMGAEVGAIFFQKNHICDIWLKMS